MSLPTVAGLFAGIGGIERGLGRAGFETELLCEIDPGAIAVLRRRMPSAPLHLDIKKLRSLPHVSTTMQIYTHVDEEARNQALTGLNDLLSSDE